MILLFSKALYLLFVFYTNWFQKRYFSISNLPLVLGSGMIVFLLSHKFIMTKKLKFNVPKPLTLWVIFAIYCLVSGVFVTSGSSQFLSSWITYLQVLILVFYIINVSMMERTNKFFVTSMFALSLVYLITMLVDGFVTKQGRLYFSETSNPNSDGMLLFAGMFCLLMLLNRKKLMHVAVGLIIVSVYMYVIIQTGSRKSFLISLFYLFCWLIFSFRSIFTGLKPFQKIILFIMSCTIIYLSVSIIVPLFFESSLYTRLLTRGMLISDEQARSAMYQEAWQMFLAKPLFGVGFKQYEVLSSFRTYSHSTYAEIIATTGIIGTVIYFFPYFLISINLIRILKDGTGTQSSSTVQYLLFMASMLILATGVIHFYSIQDNIMFALMISFYEIEKRKRHGRIHSNLGFSLKESFVEV